MRLSLSLSLPLSLSLSLRLSLSSSPSFLVLIVLDEKSNFSVRAIISASESFLREERISVYTNNFRYLAKFSKLFIAGTYCEQDKFISRNLSISCRDQGANILFLEAWSTTRKTNTHPNRYEKIQFKTNKYFFLGRWSTTQRTTWPRCIWTWLSCGWTITMWLGRWNHHNQFYDSFSLVRKFMTNY